MAGVIDTAFFGLVHDFFKVYLPHQKKSSPHTIRAYQTALESLFDFIKEHKNINLSEITFEMIDSKMLSSFLDSLEKSGCGISTRNHRLNCIRSFYAYAAGMDSTAVVHRVEILKVPKKKTDKPDFVDYMSEAAVRALLEQPDILTKKGLRDRFLMLLMYDTAARIQEILNICLCDIRLGKTPTIILRGKGSKIRTVPLMKQTIEHFENYMRIFHSEESDYSQQPLFYGERHREKYALDASTVRKMIAAYGLSAREKCFDVPPKVHPHLFRHSRAMHLYQHGMDLTLISQWLGHAQLDTTLIYAHADTEHKRRAIEVATGKNSPLKNKLNSERYTISDDDILKKLYGLK